MFHQGIIFCLKHVYMCVCNIQIGGDDAEVFRNRKSYFSLNVQVVANANKEIIDIVARWPGSVHDSTIFQNSNLRILFETRQFHNCLLLGM